MKYLFLLIGGLAAAMGVFLIITFSFKPGDSRKIQPEGPIVVILKATSKTNPVMFWNVVQMGINEAAREFGVEVEIDGPDYEYQIERQINIFNKIIERRPPLIVLAATDYKLLAEPVKKAAENNIPVITMDSGVDSTYPVSFIATDNIEAGRKAGKELLRLNPEGTDGSVAIISHVKETATSIERETGIREVLGDWMIKNTWYCDNDKSKAYKYTMKILENPDIKGIIALNEIVTLGVAKAVKEKNASERVVVIGFDSAPDELAYLENDVIKATIVQRPYNMGYISIKTAVEYLQGKKVAPVIDTGSVLITADNMFKREYQELLFPVKNSK